MCQLFTDLELVHKFILHMAPQRNAFTIYIPYSITKDSNFIWRYITYTIWSITKFLIYTITEKIRKKGIAKYLNIFNTMIYILLYYKVRNVIVMKHYHWNDITQRPTQHTSFVKIQNRFQIRLKPIPDFQKTSCVM